ncbi:hypothetical protein C7B67_16370 [filamentous cyanobacterium Phorm 6]|nr:hypothetical protein C7B67_16370 [filamentous cyanobacterium Phorm 6]
MVIFPINLPIPLSSSFPKYELESGIQRENNKKQTMKKKKVIAHIHNRIKKLAVGAIDRGDIKSCDRQSDDSYIIIRNTEFPPTIYTTVGAGTLLYLLNSLARETTET